MPENVPHYMNNLQMQRRGNFGEPGTGLPSERMKVDFRRGPTELICGLATKRENIVCRLISAWTDVVDRYLRQMEQGRRFKACTLFLKGKAERTEYHIFSRPGSLEIFSMDIRATIPTI